MHIRRCHCRVCFFLRTSLELLWNVASLSCRENPASLVSRIAMASPVRPGVKFAPSEMWVSVKVLVVHASRAGLALPVRLAQLFVAVPMSFSSRA